MGNLSFFDSDEGFGDELICCWLQASHVFSLIFAFGLVWVGGLHGLVMV